MIPGSRIIISRDQDSADCKEIKNRLEQIAQGRLSCPFKIRIVCRELESWFLGDLSALAKTYPRFKPESISHKSELRFVDEIFKPSTLLLKVIPEYAQFAFLPKIENAEKIAPNLDLNRNTSSSFIQMIQAIKYLAEI
ncbi:MAG: DUF4276 family protein [Bacteroidia bacterium]|nr:DUF4276 family protein [Bacteroidia bacterium]